MVNSIGIPETDDRCECTWEKHFYAWAMPYAC